MEKVLIVKQKIDEDTWVKIRRLCWNYNLSLFDELDRLTYDIVKEANGVIEYKKGGDE